MTHACCAVGYSAKTAHFSVKSSTTLFTVNVTNVYSNEMERQRVIANKFRTPLMTICVMQYGGFTRSFSHQVEDPSVGVVKVSQNDLERKTSLSFSLVMYAAFRKFCNGSETNSTMST